MLVPSQHFGKEIGGNGQECSRYSNIILDERMGTRTRCTRRCEVAANTTSRGALINGNTWQESQVPASSCLCFLFVFLGQHHVLLKKPTVHADMPLQRGRPAQHKSSRRSIPPVLRGDGADTILGSRGTRGHHTVVAVTLDAACVHAASLPQKSLA